MNLWLRTLVGLLFLLTVTLWALVKEVPRTPYAETTYYATMVQRLDSLERNWAADWTPRPLKVGWSKVSLTPEKSLPLAGYGARSPKEFAEVTDSVFVRAIVFDNGLEKSAWLSADLLVIHPEVSQRFFSKVSEIGWSRHQIFLSATHTHSSIGAWAPAYIGELFAGPYNEAVVKFIVERLVQSLQQATENVQDGAISYNELQVPELVRNRLVKDRGIVDPWLKVLGIRSGQEQGYATVYSAHATSLSHDSRGTLWGLPWRLQCDGCDRYGRLLFLLCGRSCGQHGPPHISGGQRKDGDKNLRGKISGQPLAIGIVSP